MKSVSFAATVALFLLVLIGVIAGVNNPGLSSPLTVNLDAGGNTITNSGAATADTDVPTFGQAKNDSLHTNILENISAVQILTNQNYDVVMKHNGNYASTLEKLVIRTKVSTATIDIVSSAFDAAWYDFITNGSVVVTTNTAVYTGFTNTSVAASNRFGISVRNFDPTAEQIEWRLEYRHD